MITAPSANIDIIIILDSFFVRLETLHNSRLKRGVAEDQNKRSELGP